MENKTFNKEQLLSNIKESFFSQNVDFETALIQNDIMYQVEKVMEKKGMKKKELAQKMDVSAAYVSQLFGNFTKMSVKDIAKIKIALGMELDFKFREENAPSFIVAISPYTHGQIDYSDKLTKVNHQQGIELNGNSLENFEASEYSMTA